MRLCELREKEVINSCDCKRLGCVVDLEFDCGSGQIEALIVPGPGKICGFLGTDSEYVIPFHCVKRIGPDIILVEIREEKFLKKYNANTGRIVYNKDMPYVFWNAAVPTA